MVVRKAIKSERIKEGRHEGIIKRIDERTTPKGYKYLDFCIKPKGSDFEIRHGLPDCLMKTSKLGKFLESIGFEVVEEAEFDFDVLMDLPISFMVADKTNDAGKTYTEIVDGTVKRLSEG